MEAKKCPFCAEEIQAEAIKCKHCGEFLEDRKAKKDPWYYKTTIIVLGFFTIGPLVLPLVWLNPNYSRLKKLIITFVVLILTFILGAAFAKSLESLESYYSQIMELTKM